MNKPDKAFQMIKYIEDQLLAGAYATGQRIPSLRTLMRKFGISYGSARRGMDYLHSKYPNICKEKGRGTYFQVNNNNNTSSTNSDISIVVCCNDLRVNTSGLYYSAFNGIISSAEKESVKIEKYFHEKDNSDASKLREITGNYSGAILLGQYDAYLSRLDLPVPAVGVMMENSFDGAISVVDLDPYLTAKLAVRYFQDRNIKNVKILSSMNNAFILRGKIFALFAQEHGIKCSKPVTTVRNYKPNTGYFFTSDNWAQTACLTYKEQTGRNLEEDFVIMGVDAKQF
jgi:DNA-binding LacI/PurR family transcriptional regulator